MKRYPTKSEPAAPEDAAAATGAMKSASAAATGAMMAAASAAATAAAPSVPSSAATSSAAADGIAAGEVLAVEGLACGYGTRTVLSDVSFRLDAGSVLVMLGPNGVGKTTLFKTLLGFIPRLAGEILVEGRDVRTWTRRQYAQAVAYVPQAHDAAFGFTVREMVLMGRTPALERLAMPKREDELIAEEVIGRLGLGHLAGRDCTTLSGGELQMVLVARALAQRPRLLVMDEPCASLDLGNQTVVLEQICRLAKSGLAVLLTSHDPNHALALDCEVFCVGMPASEKDTGADKDADRYAVEDTDKGISVQTDAGIDVEAGADADTEASADADIDTDVDADTDTDAAASTSACICGTARSVLNAKLLSRLYGVDIGIGSVYGAQGRESRVCAVFLDGKSRDHGDQDASKPEGTD